MPVITARKQNTEFRLLLGKARQDVLFSKGRVSPRTFLKRWVFSGFLKMVRYFAAMILYQEQVAPLKSKNKDRSFLTRVGEDVCGFRLEVDQRDVAPAQFTIACR